MYVLKCTNYIPVLVEEMLAGGDGLTEALAEALAGGDGLAEALVGLGRLSALD